MEHRTKLIIQMFIFEDPQDKHKKLKIVRFGVLEKMDRSVRCQSMQELIKNNEKTVDIERNKLMGFKKKVKYFYFFRLILSLSYLTQRKNGEPRGR